MFSAPSTVQRRALSGYRQVSVISVTKISTRALRRMSLLGVASLAISADTRMLRFIHSYGLVSNLCPRKNISFSCF